MTGAALPGPVPTVSSVWRRSMIYTVASLVLVLRKVGFMVFTVGLPVTMYLIFDRVAGGGPAAVEYSAAVMVNMAAYGGLGAALNAGYMIQAERADGWFRHLLLTGLPARALVLSRLTVASLITLPSIVLVFVAGRVAGHVRLPIATLAVSGLTIWLTLLPMILLGLVIALWFRSQTGDALTTVVMLLLSLLGGLWFPTEIMPGFMRVVGQLLPSYWIGELARWPLTGGPFAWRGAAVLLAWSASLVVLGIGGYRRAVRTSPR